MNDATAAQLDEKLKHYVSQGIVPPGYDAFVEVTRRPPFYMEINLFKNFPHTAQLYGSRDDAGRTALLEGRLPTSALSALQLTQVASLQPFLPEALQHFSPATVLLGLGQSPRMCLAVTTPPPPDVP